MLPDRVLLNIHFNLSANFQSNKTKHLCCQLGEGRNPLKCCLSSKALGSSDGGGFGTLPEGSWVSMSILSVSGAGLKKARPDIHTDPQTQRWLGYGVDGGKLMRVMCGLWVRVIVIIRLPVQILELAE